MALLTTLMSFLKFMDQNTTSLLPPLIPLSFLFFSTCRSPPLPLPPPRPSKGQCPSAPRRRKASPAFLQPTIPAPTPLPLLTSTIGEDHTAHLLEELLALIFGFLGFGDCKILRLPLRPPPTSRSTLGCCSSLTPCSPASLRDSPPHFQARARWRPPRPEPASSQSYALCAPGPMMGERCRCGHGPSRLLPPCGGV